MLSKKIHKKLELAGILVDGSQDWGIQVNDRRWFRLVFLGKNLGLGESYMDGWWDCRRIDEMINHLLRSGIQNEIKGGLRYLSPFLTRLPLQPPNQNSQSHNRQVSLRSGQ